MIGAMAVVGDNFKKEIIFVPQMLAAARAMKAGVEELKPYLNESIRAIIRNHIIEDTAEN